MTFKDLSSGFDVSIPIIGTNVIADIRWGDGILSNNIDISSGANHTYSSSGTYTANINILSGDVTSFKGDINNTPVWTGVDKVTSVDVYNIDEEYLSPNKNKTNWNLGPNIPSFQGLFKGAVQLVDVPLNIPTSVTDTSYMFDGAEIFVGRRLGTWNTHGVTDMKYMFRNAKIFNTKIIWWDTKNVNSFQGIFYNAYAINQELKYWPIKLNADLSDMFVWNPEP